MINKNSLKFQLLTNSVAVSEGFSLISCGRVTIENIMKLVLAGCGVWGAPCFLSGSLREFLLFVRSGSPCAAGAAIPLESVRAVASDGTVSGIGCESG